MEFARKKLPPQTVIEVNIIVIKMFVFKMYLGDKWGQDGERK